MKIFSERFRFHETEEEKRTLASREQTPVIEKGKQGENVGKTRQTRKGSEKERRGERERERERGKS